MAEIKQLKDEVFTIIKEQIQQVINGETKEVKFPFSFPREIAEWLEQELKFEVDIDALDTNGWDWDWWQPCSKDGVNYTLAGSGYEGTMRFHKGE